MTWRVCTHTARRQTSSLALPHQPSRPPRDDQYEICGLARIFHTDHLRRPGRQMDPALDSHCDLESMYTYSPASKCSSALPHQPSPSPRHDQYEISGLDDHVESKRVIDKQQQACARSLLLFCFPTPSDSTRNDLVITTSSKCKRDF